jgi:transcriptional regulator with XRE-family HTH domain
VPRTARTDLLAAFGQAVRDARLALGVSQERLAELAQVHRTYVGDIERGERNVSLRNIERLADALGLTMASLMAATARIRDGDDGGRSSTGGGGQAGTRGSAA